MSKQHINLMMSQAAIDKAAAYASKHKVSFDTAVSVLLEGVIPTEQLLIPVTAKMARAMEYGRPLILKRTFEPDVRVVYIGISPQNGSILVGFNGVSVPVTLSKDVQLWIDSEPIEPSP